MLDPLGALAAMQLGPREVILVPGSGPEDAAPDFNAEPPDPLPANDNQRLRIDFEDPQDAPDSRGDVHAEAAHAGNIGLAVRVLRPGGRLYAPGGWEFVPYNDATLRKAPAVPFLSAVESKRHELMFAASLGDRTRALKDLVLLYVKKFGAHSTARNRISLFLYAGTLTPAHWITWGTETEGCSCTASHHCWPHHHAGILYTGDGYLNSQRRLDALTRFLGPRRSGSISCLQVMHHGAKNNCYEEVPYTLDPCFSVFSSDPDYTYKHPHKEVRDMFTGFRTYRANKTVASFFSHLPNSH